MYYLIWQVLTDPLNQLWNDERKAHDPCILQVIDRMAHKKIIADVGLPKPGTPLASLITAPQPSRLAIADAKTHWLNFCSAKISPMDLME